jgi:hypothetical protein
MQKIRNPASAATLGGADYNAWRQSSPYKPIGAKNKAPIASNSPRLISAARKIEIVHHYSAAGVRGWHIVLTENAGRKSVAAYASKREAIEQLGFFSQKLHAKIVGRGSVVQR